MKPISNYWLEKHTFKSPDDIPDIPVYKSNEEKEFYINKLIEFGAIPKDNLIKGKSYIGNCRNATQAIWNGEKFIYQRTKFNYSFNESISHFQDDDYYDVFIPIKAL